jgi:hypothetical protein
MWVDKNKSFLLSKRGGQEQWFLFIHELCPSFLSVFSSSQFPLPCLILSLKSLPFLSFFAPFNCGCLLMHTRRSISVIEFCYYHDERLFHFMVEMWCLAGDIHWEKTSLGWWLKKLQDKGFETARFW